MSVFDEVTATWPDTTIANLTDLCSLFGASHPRYLPRCIYDSLECGPSITLLFEGAWTLDEDSKHAGRWFRSDEPGAKHELEYNDAITWETPDLAPIQFVLGSIVEGSEAERFEHFTFGEITATELKEWLQDLEEWAENEFDAAVAYADAEAAVALNTEWMHTKLAAIEDLAMVYRTLLVAGMRITQQSIATELTELTEEQLKLYPTAYYSLLFEEAAKSGDLEKCDGDAVLTVARSAGVPVDFGPDGSVAFTEPAAVSPDDRSDLQTLGLEPYEEPDNEFDEWDDDPQGDADQLYVPR